jgi:hypothetical protein
VQEEANNKPFAPFLSFFSWHLREKHQVVVVDLYGVTVHSVECDLDRKLAVYFLVSFLVAVVEVDHGVLVV